MEQFGVGVWVVVLYVVLVLGVGALGWWGVAAERRRTAEAARQAAANRAMAEAEKKRADKLTGQVGRLNQALIETTGKLNGAMTELNRTLQANGVLTARLNQKKSARMRSAGYEPPSMRSHTLVGPAPVAPGSHTPQSGVAVVSGGEPGGPALELASRTLASRTLTGFGPAARAAAAAASGRVIGPEGEERPTIKMARPFPPAEAHRTAPVPALAEADAAAALDVELGDLAGPLPHLDDVLPPRDEADSMAPPAADETEPSARQHGAGRAWP